MLYTVLNILILKGLHCKGRDFLDALPGYETMKGYLTGTHDGCEQNVCDRLFFAKWTADTDGLPVLKEHLKLLFRRLYMYHWLVTTAGGSVDWLHFMNGSCNVIFSGGMNSSERYFRFPRSVFTEYLKFRSLRL